MERKSEKKKKNHDTISSALESAMQEVLKTKGLEKVSLKKDEKKAIKEEAKEILKQRELDLEKKERQNMKNQIIETAINGKILLTHRILKIIAKEQLRQASLQRVKESGIGIFERSERQAIIKEVMKKVKNENKDGNILLTDELLELIVTEQLLDSPYSFVEPPVSMRLDLTQKEEIEKFKDYLHEKIDKKNEEQIKKEEERKASKATESKKKETRREREQRLGIEFIPFTQEEKEKLIIEHDKLIMSVASKYNNLRIDMDEKYDICRLYFVKAMDNYNNNPVLFQDKEKSAGKFITLATLAMQNALTSVYRKEKRTLCSLQDLVSASNDSDGASRQEDRVKDDKIPSIEALLERDFVRDALSEAIDRLPKAEQMVIGCFYGLCGYPKMNQKAIAQELEITPSEVANIRAQAMKMLRKDLETKSINKPPQEF